MARTIGLVGSLVIVGVIALFVAVGALRRINVYEAFVDGAKDGFQVAITIIPYLIAILVAISVFRTTGGMEYLVNAIGSAVAALGLPTEWVAALPVGLMRPLSGSGARGLMVDVMTTYGVASFQGTLACIIQGSTETTFYVLAVYFGSVNIKNSRYALACGLFADLVALVARRRRPTCRPTAPGPCLWPWANCWSTKTAWAPAWHPPNGSCVWTPCAVARSTTACWAHGPARCGKTSPATWLRHRPVNWPGCACCAPRWYWARSRPVRSCGWTTPRPMPACGARWWPWARRTWPAAALTWR
jgi:spore maturation protein SpmB